MHTEQKPKEKTKKKILTTETYTYGSSHIDCELIEKYLNCDFVLT